MKARSMVLAIVGVGTLAALVMGRPMRYEIPGNYRGWMEVQFENSECPPLRSQGIFRVVSIQTDGRVCTSDHHPRGWTYYKFEYVYPDSTRKSLHWNDPGRSGTQVWLIGHRMEDQTDEIFVGDEEAMNHSGPPPSKTHPTARPISRN